MTNQEDFHATTKTTDNNGSVVDIQKEVDEFRAADPDLRAEEESTTHDGDAVEGDESNNNADIVQRHNKPANNDTSKHSPPPRPFKFVPLKMGGNGRTHVVSAASRRLIEEEVTLEDLEKMTELFYEKAFQDPTLDVFIRSHDDPHGARFAKWIHQKLSGSTVWDRDRKTRNLEPVTLAGGYRHVVHDRSSAHAAAWYSPKRPTQDVGRHFQLDECRVWMRLHFWAMRESGMMVKSPSFADYYTRFIAHFVRVYESSAPAFARDSLRWSEDPANIQAYIQNGRRMTEVWNLTLEEAEDQIPEHEANDFEWPYNKTDPHQ